MCFSINDTEIKVDTKELKKLLHFVGDGDFTIDFFSKHMSHINPKYGYWSNYITLEFTEFANGNIPLVNWEKASTILNSYNEKDGIDFIDIQSSHNKIVIDFIDNLPLGIY